MFFNYLSTYHALHMHIYSARLKTVKLAMFLVIVTEEMTKKTTHLKWLKESPAPNHRRIQTIKKNVGRKLAKQSLYRSRNDFLIFATLV